MMIQLLKLYLEALSMFDQVSNFLCMTDINNIKKILNQRHFLAQEPTILITSESFF